MENRCPECGKATVDRAKNPTFPFCCDRCRSIDLGQWLSETYRVPIEADEATQDDGEAQAMPAKDELN